MLKSQITVDLPSAETNRHHGPIEWVRSLFGAKIDLRSGKEELTVSAFSLVEGLIAGFAKAGVTDALSFLVDKAVVYIDTNDVPDDLPLIAKAAETTGILDKKFREMHLVLAHKSTALHTIIDCRITNKVVLGQAEMSVDLSSRLFELQITKGETAKEYGERVTAFASKESSFEPGRAELDILTQRIADALAQSLVGGVVTREPAVVQLVRPGAKQIAGFRSLEFGDNVRAPSYRAVPTTQRAGAYADPFYYYYYDPYYDFTSYMLVSSMMSNTMWHSPNVYVVDPGGHALYSGADVPSGDAWIGQDAVSYGDGGSCVVNDSVPSSWSDGDAFGSSSIDSGSSCASASSDSSTSCASSSSCSSSSGGGSSCGSSCSSGSSCGSSCSSS